MKTRILNIFFLVLLHLFFPFLTKAQDVNVNKMEGIWVGKMSHNSDGYSDQWEIILVLKQNDSILHGTSKIIAGNRYSIFTLKGKVRDDSITTREGDIIEEKAPRRHWAWCMGRAMKLKLVSKNIIEGTWSSPMKDCSSGIVTLHRNVPLPEEFPTAGNMNDTIVLSREIFIKEEFKTQKNTITLKIWDNNQVDGDILSLKLNGEDVLVNHELTKKPKVITLNLRTDENILELFAINLGKIHPNTAAILLIDGNSSKSYILNSNFGKSEAIRIDRHLSK